MSPELLSSLSLLITGVLGGVTALILALKRRAAEEELPALRDRVKQLEEELVTARREILELDRRSFGLERLITQRGETVPEHLRRTTAIVRPIRAEDEG